MNFKNLARNVFITGKYTESESFRYVIVGYCFSLLIGKANYHALALYAVLTLIDMIVVWKLNKDES